MRDHSSTARQILEAYCALDHTALARPSLADKRLASALVARGVTYELARAAFMMAIARRLTGSSSQPIRSLAYFVPVIDELLADPPEPDYIAFLDRRLHGPKNSGFK